MDEATRVLFVCIGNICRSPTAEAVFRQRVDASGWQTMLQAESAGTSAFHVGEPPDRRAQKQAAERGYNLSALRARQLGHADFGRFDLILCMERSVLDAVRQLQRHSGSGRAEAALFLDYLPGREGEDVPDPYYGGSDGFEAVLDLVEAGCDSLLRALLKKQGVFGCGC